MTYQVQGTNNSAPTYWDDRPEDLYQRRSRDRLTTLFCGLAKIYEGITQVSTWKPENVEFVDRIITAVITAREEVAEDVVSLVFKDPLGGLFPVWNPGAHIDLILPSGKKRQYSLTGNSNKRTEYRIAVRKIAHGGGGSIEVHDTFKVGDTITFEGPRNAFHYSTRNGKVLFIAGGIGITPIFPMISFARKYGVDWKLVYAGRNRKSMPFVQELVSIDSQRVTIWADNERGGPATVQDLLIGADDDTSLYICGPIPMLELILSIRSKDSGALYYERFSPPPVVNGKPFDLVLAATGKTLHVPPDRSALDVMIDDDLPVAYSCRQGFCGTCKMRVLEGVIDHRAKGKETDNEILICTSRAKGDRLVVDA